MAQLKISKWAIQNPIPVTVLFVGLLLAGIACFQSLPIKLLPNTELPIINVTVTQSGAAPSEMERQITRPMENALSAVAGVKHIDSTVTLGQSNTTIQFEVGTNLQKSLDEVRSTVDKTRVILPQGIDPPTVSRVDFDSTPIMTYAVTAPDKTPAELSWFIDDTVSRALQGGKDVAQVTRVGGVEREINVILDPERMQALGVTAPQINSAIAAANLDDTGGRAAIGTTEQTIRVLGSGQTVEAVRNLSIPLSSNRFVKLGDLAEVHLGAEEERSFARLDGRPVVGFQVQKTKDGSDVTAERSIHVAMEKLQKTYPTISFTQVLSTAKQTRASYESTSHVLIEGMILAAIVVFIFLRDWRATLIASVAMPLSLVPTFAVMALLHFSLNGLTLLALTLVIGILVDDAIVEIENIEKRIEAGMSPYVASITGADAIGLAVVATTATIVAVFAPVSFMGGVSGMFFREFGLTVAAAVFMSLLVARLVTPLMAAYFLKPKKHPAGLAPMPKFYAGMLDWALKHKFVSLLIGFAAVILALVLAGTRPLGFQPTDDSGYFYVHLQMAPGTTPASLDQVVSKATGNIMSQADAEHVFASVDSTASNAATLTVVLKDKRHLHTQEFMKAVRPSLTAIPDVQVSTQTGFGTADVAITLTSDDPSALAKAQRELMTQMAGLHEISGVRPSPMPSGAELVIRPNMDEAARLGVSAQTLASVLRVATIGDIDAQVAKFSIGEQRVPIRVRLPLSARSDLTSIGNLQVTTASGETTPLSSLASMSFEAGPGQIVRHDRRRQATVEADLEASSVGVAFNAIHALPFFKALPAGVEEAVSGTQEQTAEAFAGFVWALAAGVFLIFAVMILLFRSFFKPMTIVSALPLVILGAFAALTIANLPITLPVLIGLLMLFGLAGKNSILLVDFIIEQEMAGVPRREAIYEACRERARPIIMTTLAMIAGMVPTALGIGEGSAFRQPMSLAVIGGLITSTILSLLLIPVAYEIVDNFEQWVKRPLGKLVTKKQPGDDAHIDDTGITLE